MLSTILKENISYFKYAFWWLSWLGSLKKNKVREFQEYFQAYTKPDHCSENDYKSLLTTENYKECKKSDFMPPSHNLLGRSSRETTSSHKTLGSKESAEWLSSYFMAEAAFICNLRSRSGKK